MQYHTNSIGPDADAFKRGMAKAIALVEESGTKQMIFLTHTLQNLDGVPKDVLGDDFVKALAKDRVIAIDELRIHLETERTKAPVAKAVVFAPFVSSELLAEVLKDYRTAELVYIPWTIEERDEYRASHPDSKQI